MDELLTKIVATLMAENLVTLEEVAQDGVRVRTSAGSGSFRRKARLSAGGGYATVEGVGSARKLARLCQEHDAFRWLCGGVPVDYHLLSDFRGEHQ